MRTKQFRLRLFAAAQVVLVGTRALLLAACKGGRSAGADAAVSAASATAATSTTTASAATSGGDAYDMTKMEMKSPPAVLSGERHTGPFSSGSALNLEAALKPLDPAPVKEIRLDTTHKIIEIAPGVKFSA